MIGSNHLPMPLLGRAGNPECWFKARFMFNRSTNKLVRYDSEIDGLEQF
jgi:hypothetical protein